MLRSLAACCGGWPAAAGRPGDALLWHLELRPHAAGEFSMAAAQANHAMEDQGQVLASPAATLVGVYDGHGGPDASRFLRSRLFPLLTRFAAEEGGMSADVIRRAFGASEEEFLQLVRRSWPARPRMAAVGSCCLLGAIAGDTLYIANLGDSRAVLGRRIGAGGPVVAERLSAEHNVAVEEVRRELAELHPDDERIVVHTRGAWRVRGIIQVSRSIGDVYLKKPEFSSDPSFRQVGSPIPLKRPVISAEPSIEVRKLKPHDLFLIFASDGLWEHLSDEAAVQIVLKNPRTGIANRLVRAALNDAARRRELRHGDLKKIERGPRRHFHDDITVVVVYLDRHHGRRQSKVVDSSFNCTNAPTDIYSFNSDESAESLQTDLSLDYSWGASPVQSSPSNHLITR